MFFICFDPIVCHAFHWIYILCDKNSFRPLLSVVAVKNKLFLKYLHYERFYFDIIIPV